MEVFLGIISLVQKINYQFVVLTKGAKMPFRVEYSDCFVGVQSYIFFDKKMFFTNVFLSNVL